MPVVTTVNRVVTKRNTKANDKIKYRSGLTLNCLFSLIKNSCNTRPSTYSVQNSSKDLPQSYHLEKAYQRFVVDKTMAFLSSSSPILLFANSLESQGPFAPERCDGVVNKTPYRYYVLLDENG